MIGPSRRAAHLLLLYLAFIAIASCQEYGPIADLTTSAFLGRWYQMATTIGFILLELGGKCVTADYKLRSDGKIELINQARPWLIPQFLARTTGFVAQSPDPDNEGAFTVNQGYLFPLNPDDTNFVDPGNYWIVGIGPIENDLYQWAVVSTPGKENVWILSRDPSTFRGSQFESDAFAVLDGFGGFDGLFNTPINTIHALCFGYPTK